RCRRAARARRQGARDRYGPRSIPHAGGAARADAARAPPEQRAAPSARSTDVRRPSRTPGATLLHASREVARVITYVMIAAMPAAKLAQACARAREAYPDVVLDDAVFAARIDELTQADPALALDTLQLAALWSATACL